MREIRQILIEIQKICEKKKRGKRIKATKSIACVTIVQFIYKIFPFVAATQTEERGFEIYIITRLC